jgi:hypothetical protein
MLTISLIDRLFTQERFSNLLTQLSRNHLPLPNQVKARLQDAPSGVIALGLRRVIDLSFTPTVTGKAMLSFITDRQEHDGSFHHCPLATAAVIGVLARWSREYVRKTLPGTTPHLADLHAIKQKAIHALGAMRSHEDCLFAHPLDHTRQERELTTAMVLLFLAGDEDSQSDLALLQLRTTLENHPISHEAHQFLAMATASSPRHAA